MSIKHSIRSLFAMIRSTASCCPKKNQNNQEPQGKKTQPILPSCTNTAAMTYSEREHATKPSKLHLKSENNRKLHLYNQVRLHIIN